MPYRTKELWVVSYLYSLNVIPDRVEYYDPSGRVFFVYEGMDEAIGAGLEAALYSGDDRLIAHLPTLARGFAFSQKWMRLAKMWRRSFNLSDVSEKMSDFLGKRSPKGVPPKSLNELTELLELGLKDEEESESKEGEEEC